MGAKPLQSDRWTGVLLVATCILFTVWTTSCGGGGGSTATVPVSTAGFGLTPSNFTFNFGNAPVGTTIPYPGPPSSATLTNTGNATLTFTSIEITGANAGDFAVVTPSGQTACPLTGGSLDAGASCGITATFKPSASGTRTAAVTFADNASGSPQSVSLTGIGTTPAAGLSPTSLTLGSQSLGAPTPAQTVTLSNSGNAALTIASISVTGTNSGDFSQSNNCGASVAAAANCTISVTFTPSIIGNESANLVVNDNNNNVSGSTQTVSLSGTGNGPGVSFSPTSVTFSPSQTVGTESAAQTITLMNTGNQSLTGISVAIAGMYPGDFALTSNTCGSNGTLAQNANCTIGVTFTPSAAGTRSASVSFTDNAAGSPQSVPLSGTGVLGQISLSPSNLTFPNEQLGATSAAQTVTVTNTESGTGSTSFLISAVASPTGANAGDFTISATTCAGDTLAPAATCTISVTFKASIVGTETALISVTDALAGSPQIINLTGTGGAPTANLNTNSLTFSSSQSVGSPSAAQTITLTNQGNAPLTLSGAPGISGTNPGDYTQTNNCGTSVAAGNSCTISVTFDPAAPGTRTATLSITDNNNDAAGSQQTVALTGGGVGPVLASLPSGLTFSGQAVGTTSAAQTVTLSNTGNAALTITSIGPTGTNSGDFGSTSTCGSSLAAGGTCTISVTFAPTASGNRTTSLAITDNNNNVPGSTQTVALSGTGNAPNANLTPATLTYSNQTVGATSPAQTATLNNSGNTTLTITSIGFSSNNNGNFAQTNNCGASLAANGSCTISITFSPVGGSVTTSLVVTDNSNNAAGTTQTVTLTGTGTGPSANLSTTNVTFSSQDVGTTSGSQTITLTDNSTSPLTLSGAGIALGGTNPSNFGLAGGIGACPYSGGTVAAGSSCTIYTTFTPSTVTSYSATISLTDNAAGSPQMITLSGSGVQGIAFSPSSLSFSSAIGTTTASQSFSVSNPSNSSSSFTINSNGITLTGSAASNFSLVSNTCNGVTLSPGVSSCAVIVQFTPSAPGTVSAAVNIADSLTGSPQSVSLSGTGTGPFASFSPTSYSFASQNVGSAASAAQLVTTLTNTGNASLNITSITSSDSTELALASGSGQCTYGSQTLAAGASCGVYATFAPTSEGIRTALISITDNASGAAPTVSLSGSGLAPIASTSTSTVNFSTAESLGQSTTQNFTLNNTGNAALAISSIALSGSGSGDFQTTTCGSSLAAPTPPATSTSCTITVTFLPVTPGSLSATLTITDNSNNVANSKQTVGLSGTGNGAVASFPPPPPPTINFGQITESTTSTGSIVLSNPSPSNASLNISIGSPSGTNASDFKVTTGSGACGTSLGIGSSCSIYVSFTPSTLTGETASITVTDSNADPTTQTVSLTGSGTGSQVSLSPSSITFATENVGTTSAASQIMLTNTGNATLTFSSIAPGGTNSGDFNFTTGPNSPLCSAGPVSAGASCYIYVDFDPSASGTRSGSVNFADNTPTGSPQAVGLSGTGAGAAVGLSPTDPNFGNQAVGSTSSPVSVTLSNSGTAALSPLSIAVTPTSSPANFNQTNNCGTSLAAPTPPATSTSCTISVTFSPQSEGAINNYNVSVSDQLSNSPQTVGLEGTGTEPVASLTLTSGSASFATATPGGTTDSVDPQAIFTLSNTAGNAQLNIASIAITDTTGGAYPNATDFTETNNCGTVLNFNTSPDTCLIMVTFTPGASGSRTATLTVTDNSNNKTNNTQTATLSGTGVHDVLVSWTPNSSGVASYDIYRAGASGGEGTTPYLTISAATYCSAILCAYPDTAVTVGQTYYYEVSAVTSTGIQSPLSSEAHATVPSP